MVWLPYGYGKVYVKRQRGHALQSMLDSSANALVRYILGRAPQGESAPNVILTLAARSLPVDSSAAR